MEPAPESARGRPSHTSLWILAVLFALPSLAAWFFYLNPDALPMGRSNRGELINPPRPLAGQILSTADGGTLAIRALQPHWTLLGLAQTSCDHRCQKTIADFRQIQKALAENAERLERLMVLIPPIGSDSFAELVKGYPGTHIAFSSDELLYALSGSEGNPQDLANSVFIIDPRGALMMRYRPGTPAKDILKDLEKLMKASKSWVKGAQYGHR